jgi:hypothetical protein
MGSEAQTNVQKMEVIAHISAANGRCALLVHLPVAPDRTNTVA